MAVAKRGTLWRRVWIRVGIRGIVLANRRFGTNAMNELASQVSSVAHVIQLAVAPVFLLAGVGALLGVLTSRLARVVDRFYALEQALAEQPSPENRQRAQTTIVSLARRARLIHWAITLCTACDLLVCVVIVVLFVGAEMHVELPGTIAALFVAAMLALIAGLVCFLREIALSTNIIENIDRSASTFIAKR